MAADSSDGAREIPLKIADDFLRENSVLVDETTRDIDDLLFSLIDKGAENAEPLLCLRCRTSRPVFFEINSLHNKYKGQYSDLEKSDMAACLLNDSGEIYLRGSQVKGSGSRKLSRKRLNWDVFLEMKDKGYRPFGVEVIQTFNPERGANLSTWAQRKVLGNSELKKYFRGSGLILISPWALIADTSKRRIKEACDAFGIWGKQAKDLEELHSSYLIHYPKAKDHYRKKTGKNYGWEPDVDFLESLTPKQDSDENLRQLDRVIRNYIVCEKNIFKSHVEEEKLPSIYDLVGDDEDENSYEDDALIEMIKGALKKKALPIIKETIDGERLKWEKKPKRKMVWELYSKGLNQREIACRSNSSQSYVSKILKEKELTESIAQESALELISLPQFRSVSQDAESIDRMIGAFRNHLISSEQEGDTPPMCQWFFEIINP